METVIFLFFLNTIAISSHPIFLYFCLFSLRGRLQDSKTKYLTLADPAGRHLIKRRNQVTKFLVHVFTLLYVNQKLGSFIENYANGGG